MFPDAEQHRLHISRSSCEAIFSVKSSVTNTILVTDFSIPTEMFLEHHLEDARHLTEFVFLSLAASHRSRKPGHDCSRLLRVKAPNLKGKSSDVTLGASAGLAVGESNDDVVGYTVGGSDGRSSKYTPLIGNHLWSNHQMATCFVSKQP